MSQWFLKKNRILVIALTFLVIFSWTVSFVFADPPTTTYTAPATLQPTCIPGDTNCTVADNLGIGSTITSGTAGSVLFAGTSGVLAQDNTNFFWDDTNNQLRIGAGTAALPAYTFAGDTTTGLYSVSAGTIGLTFSGTQRYSITATSFVSGTTGGFTITRAAGSATSPTYAFSGDTNTGMYRDTADTLEFATAGSERARFDSSGNFGIGETSPLSLLTVGSGDLFQVNSSGAIASATGITSSGTINFSGLTASKPVFTDASKNLVSTGTLGIDQGGTGLTSTPTNGQLFIGNGTGYTLATLTAGTGVSVTTGAGSITIAATGAASNEFADNVFTIIDDGDSSKEVVFQVSGLTAATTRTLTVPDASGTLALTTTPGTSGTDVNWSTAGRLNIPDASTSARGLITTGSQTFSGSKSFSGNVSFNASSFVYRTTNGGSNISSPIMLDIDGSASTSGSQAVAFESANGVIFTVANGSRRIARGAMKITNAVNTAGSETGDLSFYTKASGAAIAERFRIDSAGKLFVTSGLAASSGTPDALCMDTSTFEITHNTGTATCTVSSERFKHNIETYEDDALTLVNKLRTVSYMYNNTTVPRIGFIAEDVEKIDTRLMFYEADGVTPRGVRYEDIVPVLAKAVQELDLKIEPLTSLDVEDEHSLGSLITQFLADAGNSITDLFAKRIHTETLCIGEEGNETCISKSELDALLLRRSYGSSESRPDPIIEDSSVPALEDPTPIPENNEEGSDGDVIPDVPEDMTPEVPTNIDIPTDGGEIPEIQLNTDGEDQDRGEELPSETPEPEIIP
jgi:hypothetical protein